MGVFNEKNFGKSDKPQSTIENLIQADEHIIERLQPHTLAYSFASILHNLPIVLIWLAIDSFMIGVMIFGGALADMGFFAIFIIGFFAVHLTPVWLWIAGIVKSTKEAKATEYIITNKRIIIKEGVEFVKYNSVHYKDIYSINIKIGLIDNMLNVSDIYITADKYSAVLFDMKEGKKLAKTIQELASNQQINYTSNGKEDNYFSN